MILALELKKLKRTGFFPAFAGAGILSAMVPICNLLFREETVTGQSGAPIRILMGANWQMMAMLNLFMIVIGACLLYHGEFADHAMQKMESLPIRSGDMFFSKCIVLTLSLAGMLIMETAAFTFCGFYWFDVVEGFTSELLKNMGYAALLCFPVLLLMTAISSACQNMWISLGVGVIGIFVTVIIAKVELLYSLFPFSVPFQSLCDMGSGEVIQSLWVVCIESVLFGLSELAYLKVRRRFQ